MSAQHLKSIDTSFLKRPGFGEPRWYQSGEAFELYLVEDQEDTLEFHFSFLDHYLEGSKDASLRYAKTRDDKGRGVEFSDLVFLEKPPPDVLKKSMQFISNVPELENHHFINIMISLKAALGGQG